MKTLIGSCTQHNRDNFETSPTYASMLQGFKHAGHNDYEFYEGTNEDAVIRTLNKDNIGKHYNKVLKMGVDEGYDCVVLMHDDVQIDDYNWSDKVEEAFKEYDVVGLAGAHHVTVKEPALWHLMSEQNQWSGAVAHPANDKQIFVTNFGPTPARCLVLDGLFLAIKVSSITDKIRFDENIPAIAHHYDIDFCLTCNENKLKLTTWPIWAVHKSPGLKDPSQEFMVSQSYFLNKWTSKS